MTVGLQTRHSLPAPLRLFVALIAMVVGIAAGATTGVAETGVAANNFESAAAVEADVNIPAGHVGSNTVVFDDWSSACCVAPNTPEIGVSRSRYPQSASHIDDARAVGQPTQLTIDRSGAAARRRASMEGQPRQPGLDRDEYPPAMFEEGGSGSSVRGIDPGDNRGAGASIGNQCRGLPDGTVVQIVVKC